MRNMFSVALALFMSVQAWSLNLSSYPKDSVSVKPNNAAVSESNAPLREVSNSSGFPSTGILDAFNRSDGSIGSNWSVDKSGFKITGNQMDVISNGMIFWNPTSFNPDQEVYVTFVKVDTSATNMDLLLKSQGSGKKTSFLEVSYNPTKNVIIIYSYTSGGGYVKCGANIPATFTNGDQLGARATADGKITVYKNGSSLKVCDVTAWPDYGKGGYLGLLAWGAPNAIFDDFGGGSTPGSSMPTSTATTKPLPTLALTHTPTPFMTQTPIPSATATNTNTQAVTSIPTAIVTKTYMPTVAKTNMPASTATQLRSPNATATYTATPTMPYVPTIRITNTFTPIATDANTPIATYTQTYAITETATKTFTNTPTQPSTLTATTVPTVNPAGYTFVSMGDAQAQVTNFTLTVNQISTLHPNFVIFNGDLEEDGVSASEMNPMTNALKTAGLFNQTFLVRGNHDDHVSGSAALWESYFETAPNIRSYPAGVSNYVSLNSNSDNLTYSFIYGNSMFIGLDVPGDVDLLTSAELSFLDSRLTFAESDGLAHAFIYFHGPMYCVESTHCTCTSRTDSSCTPSALITVVNKHPIVSAFFQGHEHIMGWTHMDNTRLSSLTGSFEEFLTSPSGGVTYNSDLFPARVDYAYMDMGNSQGFVAISVNGYSYTVNYYKVGTTAPVWSKTFTDGDPVANNTPAPTLVPSLTQAPSLTQTPTTTRTPTQAPSLTQAATLTQTPTPTRTPTQAPSLTQAATLTQTPTSTGTPTPVITGTPVLSPTNTGTPITTNTPPATNTPVVVKGPVVAFPGAEGFGAGSVGGRGGKVYEVTNTNDSGSGSLRSCIEASGPRICIFRTGGLITLNSPLTILNPYITIAGQTAPGGGITIKLGSSSDAIFTKTHDVIIRYITVRPGAGGENHGNQIAANGVALFNIMIDHNTYSWGVDSDIETWYRVTNSTIQWSLISEALNCSTHSKGCHSKGLMIGGYAGSEQYNSLGSENISVLNNLMASNVDRNPLIQMCGIGQVINNVTYNAGVTFSHQQLNCAGTGYSGTSYVNWINNYHKAGPSGVNTDLKIIPSDSGVCSPGKVYMSGNVGNNGAWTYSFSGSCASVSANILTTAPAPAPAVNTTTAKDAYNNVLAGSGNNMGLNCDGSWFARRDAIDTRIVSDVINGTGRIIDDPSQVGGWITPASGTACVDSDHDGMPDVWEQAHGLNPMDASDGSKISSTGYTNLEDYLNGSR